jgi:hypothetical protein
MQKYASGYPNARQDKVSLRWAQAIGHTILPVLEHYDYLSQLKP